VADLSEDLRRHLEGLPVLAREEQFGYRAGKFMRRHRLAAGAAALIACSLVGGIVATTIQARHAERRFQEVRGLANSFLFEIHDQIEVLPGSTRVRESIVRTVLKYLNNLADEAHGDPALQLELAAAYQKIGDVQGYGVRPNLGQREAAIESHNKALAIALQLAAKDNSPRVIRLLALSHHRVGFLKEGGQQSSQGGIDHYIRAEELLDPLFQGDPSNSSDAPLLISIYGHHGDAEVLRGHPSQAAALWLKAVNTAEEWARRQPGDASRTALGVAHWRLAKGAQFSGALDGARRHAMRAIALQEELVAAQPINPARQRMLLNSYERMAFVAADPENLNLGDRPTAFRWNSKVVEIARRLRDADPSNRMAESDYLIALRSQCQFAPEDDPEALIRICQEGVSLVRRPDFIEVGPMAATRIGPVLARNGRRAEALRTMNEGLEQLISATTRFPWRVDLKRQLIRFHRVFGSVYLALNDRKQALVEYLSALNVTEPLLKSVPNDLVLRRDAADLYLALGQFYEPVAPEKALEWYRKDLAVWTGWSKDAESSVLDTSRKAEALRNVARCMAHGVSGGEQMAK
jgi:eukaryotic-like serine/threonine-protein kinase